MKFRQAFIAETTLLLKTGGLKMILRAESADSRVTETSYVVRIGTIMFCIIRINVDSPSHSIGPLTHVVMCRARLHVVG